MADSTEQELLEAARRLAQRLESALEHRSAMDLRAGKEAWTPYTLAKQSGVSYPQVTRLMGRSKAGPTRGKYPRRDTIRKLAVALGVSPDWLAEGNGPMVPAPVRVVEKPDRYRNRATAATFAREAGVSAAAIESVLADELDSDEDQPVLWWSDRMRMREVMLREHKPVGTPVKADEIPPPRGPRRRTGT